MAALTDVVKILAEAGVPYAIIGGHAVNVWLEPRFTRDVDITLAIEGDALSRLLQNFRAAGYETTQEHGAAQPSGPDFLRLESVEGQDVFEFQLAKTRLQSELIRRAQRTGSGVRIATVEDLLVLKLIADRNKDWIDIEGLSRLPDIDWAYVEGWCKEWEIVDRYRKLRDLLPRD